MLANFRTLHKVCRECSAPLVLRSTRDIDRKKYCSYACRQKYRFKHDPAFQKMFFSKVIPSGSTPEANMKKANRGEKNGRFYKDRTKPRGRLRPETSAFKKAVFERDGHKCVKCGSKETLVADHIKPYAAFPELRYEPNNGQTLCVPCHKKTPTYGAKTTKLIREMRNAPVPQ